MASDGIEQKMPVRNIGLGPEAVGDVDEATSADLIELSGVIKWFDVAKGFGFIVPDNGMADVLLHVTCLRRDGFQTAYEGARVVVRGAAALEGPAGLPHPLHGRVDGDASGADAAAAHPCYGDAHERSRTGAGEMVQPACAASAF